jgi:hypothetical protein
MVAQDKPLMCRQSKNFRKEEGEGRKAKSEKGRGEKWESRQ